MLSSRTNSFYQFQECGHSLKRAYLEHLTQGLKLTFCHTCQWPVMLSNLPAKIFFYQPWNSFCKNRQSLLLQWLNIFTMFLIFPLLNYKKNNNKEIYWYIFSFLSIKNVEILVLCMFFGKRSRPFCYACFTHTQFAVHMWCLYFLHPW